LHQGAIVTGVPIPWLPRTVTLVRPRGSSHQFIPLSEAADAFAAAQDGMEMLVAVAKLRPVIVISPGWEIENRVGVRVVPVYSWTESTAAERQSIIAGERPALMHVATFRRLREGVAKLHEQQSVFSGHLGAGRHIASLTTDSLAELLARLAQYAVVRDDRLVR
jgi:hypothetical protein